MCQIHGILPPLEIYSDSGFLSAHMLCECMTPLPRGAFVSVQRCSFVLRCAALSISTLMTSVIQVLTDLSQWKQPLFNIQKHTSFSFQSLTRNETHFLIITPFSHLTLLFLFTESNVNNMLCVK